MERVLAEDVRAALVERGERVGLRADDLAHLRHALAREAEVLRIDVARVDEPAGLLCAPARICRVDEPALVVHEAVQVTPRTGEPLANVFPAGLQKLGPDDIAHAEDLTQDVDDPLRSFEAQQHARHAA